MAREFAESIAAQNYPQRACRRRIEPSRGACYQKRRSCQVLRQTNAVLYAVELLGFDCPLCSFIAKTAMCAPTSQTDLLALSETLVRT